MLRVWDATHRRLVDLPAPNTSTWIHAVDPSEDELAILRDRLGLPAVFIPHALDADEVARVDREGDSRLIVVRMPVQIDRENEVGFESMAVGVVLLKGRIVTIARRDGDVFDTLARRDDLAPDHHERFVLQLLLVIAERFLTVVRLIDRDVARLEDQLQLSLRNKEVYGLLKLQKVLVHFSTAIASDQILVDRLLKDRIFEIHGDDRELLEDVEVELRQAEAMTSTSRNILSEMMDAFASIISNNLNRVMKVMAAVTIILILPGTIAGFYGMNVPLPGQYEPRMFELLILVSVSVVLVVGVIFYRKRWL